MLDVASSDDSTTLALQKLCFDRTDVLHDQLTRYLYRKLLGYLPIQPVNVVVALELLLLQTDDLGLLVELLLELLSGGRQLSLLCEPFQFGDGLESGRQRLTRLVEVAALLGGRHEDIGARLTQQAFELEGLVVERCGDLHCLITVFDRLWQLNVEEKHRHRQITKDLHL